MASEEEVPNSGVALPGGGAGSKAEEPSYSLALRYQEERRLSPQVLVGGSGLLAQRIAKVAEQNGVSVEDKSGLSHLLAQLDRNKPIPLEGFQIVAEVLTFLYGLEQSINKGCHR